MLDSLINSEDIDDELISQIASNQALCIEIMKESLDAELTYNYMNIELGKGILIGIVLTLLGQRIMYADIEALEAAEDDSDAY